MNIFFDRYQPNFSNTTHRTQGTKQGFSYENNNTAIKEHNYRGLLEICTEGVFLLFNCFKNDFSTLLNKTFEVLCNSGILLSSESTSKGIEKCLKSFLFKPEPSDSPIKNEKIKNTTLIFSSLGLSVLSTISQVTCNKFNSEFNLHSGMIKSTFILGACFLFPFINYFLFSKNQNQTNNMFGFSENNSPNSGLLFLSHFPQKLTTKYLTKDFSIENFIKSLIVDSSKWFGKSIFNSSNNTLHGLLKHSLLVCSLCGIINIVMKKFD